MVGIIQFYIATNFLWTIIITITISMIFLNFSHLIKKWLLHNYYKLTIAAMVSTSTVILDIVKEDRRYAAER